MTEQHRIVGQPRGEPWSAARVGVRVRVPLSGVPSARWSRDLSARLVNELVGHPHVGHLRLDGIAQGSELVLDGVEPGWAGDVAAALRRAVDGTNRACTRDRPRPTAPQEEADAAARDMAARQA